MAEIEVSKAKSRDGFQELMSRAEKGDKTCLPQLREVLRDQSSGSDGRWLVENYGSPPNWLRNVLVAGLSQKDLAIRESAEAKLRQLRAELEGPNPTALEKLLVERAVYCWFLVYQYELRHASADSLSITQADFQQRRIDGAHKRFLSALATLAKVRKLAVPTLLVAVAGEQRISVQR